MKKNKKGFTLVELLAVLIVLIIILLIAITRVRKTVDDASDKSIVANAGAYIKAVNADISNQDIMTDSIYDQGKVDISEISVNISGTKPSSGFVEVEDEEVVNACLVYGKYKIIYTSGNFSKPIKGKCVSNEYAFSYTGETEKFTVPVTGTYKIEVWGAQGGTYNDTYIGGYGAYAVGQIDLTEGRDLYINVGGKGVDLADMVNGDNLGGFNGGGKSYIITSSCSNYCGSGGGASSVASLNGELSSLSSSKGTLSQNNQYYVSSSIIIVAAGGGGATYRYCSASDNASSAGGSGGGYLGLPTGYMTNMFSYTLASGGTQTAGGAFGTSNNESGGANGSFGQGGFSTRTGGYTCETGGGGGFFGGGNGSFVGGGGGSSYIANSNLTSKKMVAYSSDSTYENNEENTKTEITNCKNENPTSNCAKEGNGFVKITLIEN